MFATGIIPFAERAGGGGGVTMGGRTGRAGGADAQAANTKSEKATAVRFIVGRPCKKRDSVGVGRGSLMLSEVHFSDYDTQAQDD
jgi:hypothetical protein